MTTQTLVLGCVWLMADRMACSSSGAPVAAMTMVAVLMSHYKMNGLTLQPQWKQSFSAVTADKIAARFAGVGHYAMVGV